MSLANQTLTVLHEIINKKRIIIHKIRERKGKKEIKNMNKCRDNTKEDSTQVQWRREEVKAGGGYFENGRKCEIFRKSEKILDECSPEFRGF